MKKIEVVIDGIIYNMFPFSGVGRIFEETLPRMCELDDKLRIQLLTDGTLTYPSLPQHRQIHHRHLPNLTQYLKVQRVQQSLSPALRRLVQRFAIGSGRNQIWHSTHYTLPGPWAGYHVVSVYDMFFERFKDIRSVQSEVWRDHKRRAFEQADILVCISESVKEEFPTFYPNVDKRKLRVVPLACSPVFTQNTFADDTSKVNNRKPFLLFVGGRWKHENFHRVLMAYSVWKYREEFDLALVTFEFKHRMRALVKSLKIDDKIQLYSRISDKELAQLYNRASAFIYPSLYEGFGLPLLEAMSCGCPIIASKIPTTVEIAQDCPIYFETDNVDSLMQALTQAVEEGRESERTRQGLQLGQQFSWDKTAQQTLNIYQSLLDT